MSQAAVSPPEPRFWSIGIYRGNSPVSLAPHPEAKNPVLTRAHVTDFPARFVADPFMVRRNGSWYMFFEVMNDVGIGAIGLATSADSLAWEYQKIVLREPFHLSYPCVFEWGTDHYMAPETLATKTVRLYRADPFPFRWIPVADLVSGSLADPSIFLYKGRWWMFACGTPYRHDSLRLFESGHLAHGWFENPASPLIENNRRISRPAGRVTPYQGGLIRFAQDCYPDYGARVRAFSMDDFPILRHPEVEAPQPILLPDAGGGWASSGMHHVDPHLISPGEWIACVDGSQG
jgi:hypothetical protein